MIKILDHLLKLKQKKKKKKIDQMTSTLFNIILFLLLFFLQTLNSKYKTTNLSSSAFNKKYKIDLQDVFTHVETDAQAKVFFFNI